MSYTRKTADIFISEEFDNILRKIQDNSEVARLLLKTRHNLETLCDGFVNYISVAQDPTKISYMTPDRIAKIQESGDFDNIWKTSKRFSAKPGAFVKKLFKDIHNTEIEKFSTLYRTVQSNPEFRFQVVQGQDILRYYLYDSYAEQTASLGASCMKHRQCQSLLNIYAENPDKIKLLIMLDQADKLIGRALLWDTDPKVMDRIYTIDDEEFSWHFKNWADTNGYLYKKEQKWNNTLFFEGKGKSTYLELSIKLNNWDFSRQPYFDTFKFLDRETGTFYNYIPSDIDIVTYSTPDGHAQPKDFLALDDKSKLFYHQHELVWIEYAGIRTHPNNTFYSEIYGTSILKEDAKFHEELNDYIFADDSKNDQKRIDDILEKINKRREENKKVKASSVSSLSSAYERYMLRFPSERMLRFLTETENVDLEPDTQG